MCLFGLHHRSAFLLPPPPPHCPPPPLLMKSHLCPRQSAWPRLHSHFPGANKQWQVHWWGAKLGQKSITSFCLHSRENACWLLNQKKDKCRYLVHLLSVLLGAQVLQKILGGLESFFADCAGGDVRSACKLRRQWGDSRFSLEQPGKLNSLRHFATFLELYVNVVIYKASSWLLCAPLSDGGLWCCRWSGRGRWHTNASSQLFFLCKHK